MSFPCVPCNRVFMTAAALEQHTANTARHVAAFECLPCGMQFGSEQARDQHVRDSPAHQNTLMCALCNKKFGSNEARDQHVRDSPAHRVMYPCILCNVNFASQSDLEVHMLSSPAHNPPVVDYACQLCNRSFGSLNALAMHLSSSPRHAAAPPLAVAPPAYTPDQTSRQSSESLERPATLLGVDTPGTPATEELPEPYETPLDFFFRSYSRFPYDGTKSPEESYHQLKKFLHLKDGNAAERKVRQKYQSALVGEVDIWFGDASDIHAWHHLCKAVGVREPPPEIKDCKKIIRNTHVNIVDLIDWARSGSPPSRPVKLFESADKLREYTIAKNKIFPRDDVVSEDGDRNIVLKHLLRQIIREPGKRNAQ